jgi:hypothetical protein
MEKGLDEIELWFPWYEIFESPQGYGLLIRVYVRTTVE